MIEIYYVFFYHKLNIFRIIYMLNPSFSPLSDVPRVRLRARVDMSMSCHQGRDPTPRNGILQSYDLSMAVSAVL